MRPTALFGLTLAAAALLGLGPARAAPAPASESCLATCVAPGLSADDQATCRLQCARLAQSSPAPAAQPAPRPATAPSPAPSSPAPRAPAAQPVAPPAPDLAHQRYLCESQCDTEASPGDRATCRLQCGQLARVSAPQPAPTPAPPGGVTVGNTTTYSFAPGGGYVPASPTPTAAPGPDPYAQQRQQIAACQATCDREASATDRATCRNNCGAVGTVLGPAAPSQWVLGPAPTMSEAEQRAAVIRSSGGVVPGSAAPGAAPPRPVTAPAQPASTPAPGQPVAAQPAPGGAQPPNPQCAAHAQQCKVACASEQTTCAAQCDQGKMSETDRATCKLTCTSGGDMCRDDCRMKEAACKPAVYVR